MDKNYTLISDIAYVPNGHPAQKLDLYIPKSDVPQQGQEHQTRHLYPLVIYIHGGAFKFGNKTSSLLPLHLLRSGKYALASLDYRLSGDAPFPAAVVDCKSAVRYLRANATQHSLDSARFLSMGESAGGYLSAMLGLTGSSSDTRVPSFHNSGVHDEISDELCGTIDLYGPTDFLQMDDHPTPGVEGYMTHLSPDSPESLFLGGNVTELPELNQRANPISYIGRAGVKIPPFLIAHGTHDRIVTYHQSVLLHEALKGHGANVTLLPVEGTDHCFEGISGIQQQELDRQIEAFLDQCLVKTG